MAVEIEAKIRVDDLSEYAQRLGQLGAEHKGEVRQRDCFFDREGQSLQRGDCGLRVRAESAGTADQAKMCYKGPRQKGQFKQRQEIEFAAESAGAARELLEALGFAITIVVQKRRQVWQLQGCSVCLDEVEGLGSFVEIEGPNETAISKVRKILRLEGHQLITDSYAQMLAEAPE